MAAKLYDLAAADEEERSSAIELVRLPVNSTALIKLSAMDHPSILTHALLLLFDGARITAPNAGGRIDLSFRSFLGSKAMIAAHAKASSARRQVQHP